MSSMIGESFEWSEITETFEVGLIVIADEDEEEGVTTP
jgi:hypothetical protein